MKILSNAFLSLAVTAFLSAGCETTSVADSHGERESGHAVHWAYAGEGAPANWARLDEKYATCASGRSQSPIDIEYARGGQGQPLRFKYAGEAAGVQNNGHTVQVDYAPGNVAQIEGRPYTLVQFHFHVPAENTAQACAIRWKRISSTRTPTDGSRWSR
jgi:Carbonic anhydrase